MYQGTMPWCHRAWDLSEEHPSRWAQFWEKEDPNAKIEYTTPGPDINERVQGTEGYIV